MQARSETIRRALREHQFEALVVSHPTNIRWLTGFAGSSGTVIVDSGSMTLVTDHRYGERAPEEIESAGADCVVDIAAGRGITAAAAHLDSYATIGIEGDHLSMNAGEQWRARFGETRIRPTSGIVEAGRAIKDQAELGAMRRAAAIADIVLAETIDAGLEGRTEADIARTIEDGIRGHGADGPAFDTIVASGPNAARPHHAPTQRTIQPQDLVIIDMGATVDGYRSDMTRTFVIGEPDPDQRRLLDAVFDAQRLGVAAVAPGVGFADVDAACRSYLESIGLGDAFVHGTGHGVGLDIHEAPAVSSTATGTLTAGHVITVEPGCYLPGIGGVRWEDTVVVTTDGAEPLTLAPKAPSRSR